MLVVLSHFEGESSQRFLLGMYSRGINCHGIYYMCKNEDENVLHLFISFPFTLQVWKYACQWLGSNTMWQGGSVEEILKLSFQRMTLKINVVVSFITFWGIFLGCRSSLFKDRCLQPFQLTTQNCDFVQYNKAKEKISRERNIDGSSDG